MTLDYSPFAVNLLSNTKISFHFLRFFSISFILTEPEENDIVRWNCGKEDAVKKLNTEYGKTE